jgi:2,3-bisphosphoglycerate-dependent phosphoglycerate mutase
MSPTEPLNRATRVFVVRHGQTAWNAQSRIQGNTDIGLDDTGRRQAQALGMALAGEGLDAIYASDLARAYETAQPAAARTGRIITTDPGLRERGFGIFEGLTHAEVAQRWPEAAQRWRRRDPDYGPESGETLAAFYARSVACAERIAARHAGQTIAIVTHGGVLDCLYRAATRASLQAPRTWQLGNAVVNRLLHSPEGFTLVGWNDAMHLEADALGVEHGAS